MSNAEHGIRAVMTSDGEVLTERPDGTYGPAPAGRSDWARVDAMSDEEITANALSDPDAQPLDDDVLAWFRGQGRGWQTRINAVLRAYYEARKGSHG